MIKKGIKNFVIYGLLLLLVAITLVPFYLITVNATHSSFDIVTQLNLLPGKYLTENYRKLQEYVNIWSGFCNSLLIAVVFMTVSGYLGALVAFGFEKYQFKGKRILYMIVLASMMIPSQVSIIGFYRLGLKIGLVNKLTTFMFPFFAPGVSSVSTIFFLRGMISQGISTSLLEAARMEGCSEFRIFNRIVLPCIMPGIATMCIFNFVNSWNNYIGPLIMITYTKKYTMPILISLVKGIYLTNYGAMYLAVGISILVVVIIYLFCSKYIIDGLTMGAEK